MKKITMTICGVALLSVMSFAQSVDSTHIRDRSKEFNDSPTPDPRLSEPRLNQSTNPEIQPTNPESIDGTPRTQDPTSPVIQSQPRQSQPQIQPQPEVQDQQLQNQPQVPTQSQPTLDRSNPAQNQLNQPVKPTEPTTPTGGGTPPR